MRSLILATGLCGAILTHAQTATFIGNCAFKFEWNGTVLYSDFPYESGYSGYDTYEAERARDLQGTTLITHQHRDHYDSTLVHASDLNVISPAQDQAARDQAIAKLGESQGIYVYPLITPHNDMPHFSYLVQWNRRRIFFSGDTEDPKELLNAQNLDVAFVTPWLLAAANKSGKRIDARLVIIYHHTKGSMLSEPAAPCDCKVLVPQQADVIRLFR